MSTRTLTTSAILAAAALASPVQAWTVSLHLKTSKLSLWITLGDGSTSANYDALTHAGVIPYSVDGPFQTMDVMLTDIPGVDGLPVTLSGDDFSNMMGEFEVVGGLGTTTCELRPIGIWVTGDHWGVHVIILQDALTSLTLDGFNPDGGLYSAQGLTIPVELHVHRPDGSVIVVPDTLTEIDFGSPLDLSDPCPADCDGNGTLNIDDIDCFIAAFLGQCA